jgi:Zn-dependent protease
MPDTLWFTVFQIAVLIYSVVLHEVSHGLAARAMGDRTAEYLGRLTLNPIKHLELFGSFILPLATKMLTGFMFGYAKPVPYNPDALDDRRWGPAKVGLAGPATNIALAVVFGLAIRFAGGSFNDLAVVLMGYVVLINLFLAVFNLIPVPPLDGHWLLMAILPARFNGLKVMMYQNQWLLLAVVIFFVFPMLSPLLNGLFFLLTGVYAF